MKEPKEQTKQMKCAEEMNALTDAVAAATWPQTRTVLRVIFIVLAVAAGLWVLYELESIILLVVLSIFFAYLIAPLVELVRHPFKLAGRERTMPRALAIAIVYAMIFGSLAIAIYLLLPRIGNQMTEFAQQAPTYLMTARGRAQKLNEFYRRYQLPPAAREAVNNTVTQAIERTGEYVREAFLTMFGWLTYLPWLILIPILAFFLLKDADSFRRSALQMIPQGRLRWRGDEFFQDVNRTLAAYIRAQLIACLLIGTICSIGFSFIGVPYALTLGIIAGALEFIPLVGPFMVAIIVAIITSFVSTGQVITALIFLAVLRIIHDYITYPRLIRHGIHLHPVAVILAVLAGHELAGVAGIFLAIPVVAVFTVAYRHWNEYRGSAGLVADLLKPTEGAVSTPHAPSTCRASNEPQPSPSPSTR
jgi:predicted PurR-regulated permease PerM